jgi:hypothetical protein
VFETGALTVTFASATRVLGTVKPNDVYYLFDVTVAASLEAQYGASSAVTIAGHFRVSALPIGS